MSIRITLPDGSQRDYGDDVTGFDVASDIGSRLAKAAVAVTVDGESWSQIAPALLMLAAWGVALFAAGAFILRRRVATL